jgi:uncharacterized iron-regulated membrane protein
MNLYRTVWLWHFYAGLILAPVLLVSAITGLLYIFKDDVRDALNSQAVFVSPDEPALDPETLVATVQRNHGGIEKLTIPAEANRSWIVRLGSKSQHDHETQEGKEGFHVHPATGDLLGPVVKEPAFFKTILGIHRRLLSGTAGRIVIELATSWAIVLMLTGVYLWWPKKPGGQGVWWPRWTGKSYAVFRDWHAVAGIYLMMPLLFILVTGLFFTYVWGSGYKWLQGKDTKSFFEPPKEARATRSTVTAGVLNHFVERARQRWPGFDLELTFSINKEAIWTIVPQTSRGPKRQGMMALDPGTGEVVAERDLSELSWLTQLRMWAYPIHTGGVWGMTSKMVAALSCLALIGLSGSGLAMWWLRRKKGTLGLPRRPEVPLPHWLLAIIALLAVLLPVMGISLLVVLAGEWVASRCRKSDPAQTEPATAR